MVLSEQIDLRSVTGLRRCVDRLRDKKVADKRYTTKFNVLQRHLDLVEVCLKASRSKIASLDEPDLIKFMAIIMKEQVHLESEFRQALLARYASRLLDRGDFKKFSQVMVPVGTPPDFDPLGPALTHVSNTIAVKATIYENTVFDLTVIPLIGEGASHRECVHAIVNECLNELKKIDLFEVDQGFASTTLTTWFRVRVVYLIICVQRSLYVHRFAINHMCMIPSALHMLIIHSGMQCLQ